MTIEQDETKVLWDYYAVEEEEGIERFDDALSQHGHFDLDLAPEMSELSRLIEQANKKTQMKFKREHRYDLRPYEEQLYKEVVFDARPNSMQLEHTRNLNLLKKGRASLAGAGVFRNLSENLPEMMDRARWPEHKRIPYKLNAKFGKNMVDPFHWIKNMH